MRFRGTSILLVIASLHGSACNIYDSKTLKKQAQNGQKAERADEPRVFRSFDAIGIRVPMEPIDPRVNQAWFPNGNARDAEADAQPPSAGKQAPRDDRGDNHDEEDDDAADSGTADDKAAPQDRDAAVSGGQNSDEPPRDDDSPTGNHTPSHTDPPIPQHQEMEATEDAGAARERSVSPADAGAREEHDAGPRRPVAKASAACSGKVGYVSEADGRCYFVLDTPVSWNVGRDHCYELDAHLASITSEREASFVASFDLESDVWIGLSRFGAVNFSWITNEVVSFTAWKKGAPRAMQESGALVSASTGLWTNRIVSELHPVLCETERKAGRNGRYAR